MKSFTTQHTFNETDQVLQNVGYWPKISDVDYFKSKLKFQIRHSLFRYCTALHLPSLPRSVPGPRSRRGTRPLARCWTGTRRSTAANWNEYTLKPSPRIYWRASLVPAAAVIPAPIAYIKVVVVKKLVVGSQRPWSG